MFVDLGLINAFNIDYETLCRWLLTVKRNYRNETVQYHNWYHAFNVAQMMFCMLTKTTWIGQKFQPVKYMLNIHYPCNCKFINKSSAYNRKINLVFRRQFQVCQQHAFAMTLTIGAQTTRLSAKEIIHLPNFIPLQLWKGII